MWPESAHDASTVLQVQARGISTRAAQGPTGETTRGTVYRYPHALARRFLLIASLVHWPTALMHQKHTTRLPSVEPLDFFILEPLRSWNTRKLERMRS